VLRLFRARLLSNWKHGNDRARASVFGVNGAAALDERSDVPNEASDRRTRLDQALLRYFAGTRASQRVLWCYLIWYLYALFRYFDASAALWLSSLGISAIIGTALYLSTAHAGKTPVRLERWQIARLYLMPFCVSSFAALIKGHGFILVFHPSLRDNVIAATACALFIAASAGLRAALR
jgi:hypothetical protein